MPSYIELLSAEQTTKGTWGKTQASDFPKGCGFAVEVQKGPSHAQSDSNSPPVQHVVKGALSHHGMPFMVVLSFSADTSDETIRESTEQVLEQVASFDKLLNEEVFKIPESGYYLSNKPDINLLKIKLGLHYNAIEAHLNKKCPGARFSVMLHIASPKHSDMHHTSYKLCMGNGNAAIYKPDALIVGEWDKAPIIPYSKEKLKEPVVFFEDAFFNKDLKFVVGHKAFGMEPGVTHYQEDFIDLFYQQQQQKLQKFIQARRKQLGEDDPCAKEAQALLNAIQTFHDNDVNNIAIHRELTAYLEKTIALLENPQDNKARKDFLAMAEEVQGKPQYGKLIGGLMLALFGVVVAGLSIAASVATGGLTLPLSSLGIKASLPLIGTGVSLLAMGGVGTLFFGAGGILAFNGRRTDLSKKMMNCYQAIPKQATVGDLASNKQPHRLKNNHLLALMH